MGAAFWQARCHNFIDIIGRQEGIIMLIGYARTSTTEQVNGLEAQRMSLRVIGCDRLSDQQTSDTGPRKALTEALGYVREGDVLVVTKLDRIRRVSARYIGANLGGASL
jgi:DNA invertase Pin-like site-specific DNA recombinase